MVFASNAVETNTITTVIFKSILIFIVSKFFPHLMFNYTLAFLFFLNFIMNFERVAFGLRPIKCLDFALAFVLHLS